MCETAGGATTAGTCDAGGADADFDDDSCGANNVCNGSGSCLLADGQDAMGAGANCASGIMEDGVCCAAACGTCEVCDASGDGTCTPIDNNTDPDDECANGCCDGASACGTNNCNNGVSCSAAGDCTSGFCPEDGVCCDEDCDTACESCNAMGMCNQLDGDDAGVCDDASTAESCATTPCECAAGVCLEDLGQACSAGAECATGFCTDAVCCNEDSADCGAAEVCHQGGTCAAGYNVFVSSVAVDPSDGAMMAGELISVAAANARCQALADAASLGGSYMAWISDGNEDALAAFVAADANGPWYLLNGELVSSTRDGLTDDIDNPIDVDETGNDGSGQTVWTGTLTAGGVAADTCTDWTDPTSGSSGRVGSSDATAAAWTSDTTNTCETTGNRIYCFEVP